MEDTAVFNGLKSRDPMQQSKAALQAGEFGIRGLIFAGELLNLITGAHGEVRIDAISSLNRIAGDGALGPFTERAFSILMPIAKDSGESDYIRASAAEVLSYCVFPSPFCEQNPEIIREFDDTVGDLMLDLQDEWALNTATEALMRIEERLPEIKT